MVLPSALKTLQALMSCKTCKSHPSHAQQPRLLLDTAHPLPSFSLKSPLVMPHLIFRMW